MDVLSWQYINCFALKYFTKKKTLLKILTMFDLWKQINCELTVAYQHEINNILFACECMWYGHQVLTIFTITCDVTFMLDRLNFTVCCNPTASAGLSSGILPGSLMKWLSTAIVKPARKSPSRHLCCQWPCPLWMLQCLAVTKLRSHRYQWGNKGDAPKGGTWHVDQI